MNRLKLNGFLLPHGTKFLIILMVVIHTTVGGGGVTEMNTQAW